MHYHYNLALAFEETAQTYSKQPALHYTEQCYDYSTLQIWIEWLTEILLSKGCRQGDVIAIANNKSPLSYALMLAAIRAGITYLNIDTESPISRNVDILKVSQARFLFYDNPNWHDINELYAQSGCQLYFYTLEQLSPISTIQRQKQQTLMQKIDGSCIAYIMFTSGSTGIPKGVAVTHQNLLHFIAWGQQQFQINAQDNFANLSPMYFDNSVFDFYVGLFSGASLTPLNRSLLSSPYELVEYVEKMKCSIWFSVPSLLIYLMTMKAMQQHPLRSLRCIVFGGEGYPKIELKKLYDLFSKQAQLINVYGPTECTCICSAYLITEHDFQTTDGLPPLGRLNNNFDYRILDEQDQDSKTGELCLIGPNVAAGYFNDLERTAASFITLTTSSYFMKRMYKTGDLVKEEQGILYFVGRKDNQIKHMGYRIELEEIEHALMKYPLVNQAAVLYHRTNSAYGKLVGYIACAQAIDERSLLTELAKKLPEYMIPSRLIIQTTLPKNPNGKVDRQKLRLLTSELS